MAVTSPSTSFEIEEFWEDLLALIEERQVIPVVGAELLDIDDNGVQTSLHRSVAGKLLRRYGLTPAVSSAEDGSADDAVVLRPHHELNDAVCALARNGRRIQDLYRPVNDVLRSILAAQAALPPALTQLAAIRPFELFVSTTGDDLLCRAINTVRFGGDSKTDQIEYAPNLSSDKVRDIPELRSTGYAAVFHIFGRASASPQFAIHDEDVLEFVYGLQAGHGHVPERMLGAMRSRNLLLVGCNFADWLSRFFIRVANQSRLFGDRTKKEFFVEAAAARDTSLTVFLQRFSQNTRIFPGSSADFVSELHKRWTDRQPAGSAAVFDSNASAPAARRHDIFVSYSSADRQAARRLIDAITSIGGDVVWFDRHDLSLGEDWKGSILGAIRRCSLFIPLISATTEKRNEGFFRLEWDEACNRDVGIQGRRFILPITIDDDYAGDPTRYELIPDRFRRYQFGHAPGGEPTERLRESLVSEIRGLRRPETR